MTKKNRKDISAQATEEDVIQDKRAPMEVDFQSTEMLDAWLKQAYFNQKPENDEDEVDLDGFEKRVLNTADITSMIDFIVRTVSQSNRQALQGFGTDLEVILQILINELDISQETIEEYRRDQKIRDYREKLTRERANELMQDVVEDVEAGKIKPAEYESKILAMYDEAAQEIEPKVKEYIRELDAAQEKHKEVQDMLEQKREEQNKQDK